jgi:GntR family transcriptional regulator
MKLTGTKPIFEEVADYYEKLITLGVYKEGDYLPSVREVALENKINPNTVQHGFLTLVEKGVVVSIPKKGYQVRSNNTSLRKDVLVESLNHLIKEGYSIEEIKEALNSIDNKEEVR